jgi:hypothetical protein
MVDYPLKIELLAPALAKEIIWSLDLSKLSLHIDLTRQFKD